MNEILHIQTGRVTNDERRTARLLLADGHPRWLVAAMLGRFPLAFNGTGQPPSQSRTPKGGNLSSRDARDDPRQFSMEDLFGPSDDDPGHPA